MDTNHVKLVCHDMLIFKLETFSNLFLYFYSKLSAFLLGSEQLKKEINIKFPSICLIVPEVNLVKRQKFQHCLCNFVIFINDSQVMVSRLFGFDVFTPVISVFSFSSKEIAKSCSLDHNRLLAKICLFEERQQWKHQKKMLNMFKDNNKNT